MGKAARMILCSLADGETDPVRLASFAVGRVRATEAQLVAALTGHVDDHHRFLLREHLTQIEHLEKALERVTAEIARRFTPQPPPEQKEAVTSHQEPASEPDPASDVSASSSPQAPL